MNTNNELKPGDRVILTGWTDKEQNFTKQYFSPMIGKAFTVKETKIYGEMRLSVNGLSLHSFTYEKIETDGNG